MRRGHASDTPGPGGGRGGGRTSGRVEGGRCARAGGGCARAGGGFARAGGRCARAGGRCARAGGRCARAGGGEGGTGQAGAAGRRFLRAQEPSGRGGYTGPCVIFGRRRLVRGPLVGGSPAGGVLVSERLVAGVPIVGLLDRVFFAAVVSRSIWVRRARARDDQARRDRPGGHEASRLTPTECTGRLRFLGWRGTLVTILTREITLRVHNRPQFVHFSGRCHSAPILALTSW